MKVHWSLTLSTTVTSIVVSPALYDDSEDEVEDFFKFEVSDGLKTNVESAVSPWSSPVTWSSLDDWSDEDELIANFIRGLWTWSIAAFFFSFKIVFIPAKGYKNIVHIVHKFGTFQLEIFKNT